MANKIPSLPMPNSEILKVPNPMPNAISQSTDGNANGKNKEWCNSDSDAECDKPEY
jgi:hypothetical protein